MRSFFDNYGNDLLTLNFKLYNKDICAHIGNCVRGNPDIFEVGRRPWIIPDNGSVENASYVVDTCPSGALKYVIKK
ncbi:(4Fe-4S)-binding protein [Enterococcus raffinosus]|uniref:(4Fe-4S)-binding protein n=1 Tax=Enterococcus raffinosus TaxID=71452 RepID=UPI0028904801|nr:(4Fe-4S)-binding protein [Enterococcus raffinosus]MDT2579945.1 (4Fe-4S)-binding protein [Enterococcus raffinosus]